MDLEKHITENAGITPGEPGFHRAGSFYKEVAVPFQRFF